MTTQNKRVGRSPAVKSSIIEQLRSAVRSVKVARMVQAEEKEAEKVAQEVALKLFTELDPNGYGIKFDIEGVEHAAFFQQNQPSLSWDMEGAIQYAKDNGLWSDVSVRQFSAARWEDLVQQGIIPSKVAQKLTVTGKPPAPFVRFGKPTDKSL